ncbi:hypothetical protein BS78_04G028600 [Paspalum vaginatum]|nr:hypothetical protein BS78_04G028600 [Paspalum vaginatum]
MSVKGTEGHSLLALSEQHGCFTERYVCRISYIWYKGKGQCACAPKTRIKPADHAYFSVADGYPQYGMHGKQTNVIRFCQLSIQFLGRIKWSGFANF